ncbi:MAG TPA: YebC/PmpR family DNA-binding transcriptional regulator, partial [Candidatus Hydrogenedentes bacterium]|nr:YebC/PmpR family DNA-binding transcriptional regulator [Candidatus Hydrogenedentota bacterium]
WNFEPRGTITVAKEGISEEDIFEKAVEAGGDDVDTEGDFYDIATAPNQLHVVAEALESMGITPSEIKLTMEPKTTLDVDGKTLTTLLRLLEELEDHDDVQDVFSNMNATDEAMAAAMGD